MTKQCPNCGNELDSQEEICENCGYSFKESQVKEENSSKISSESNQPSEKTEETSSFLTKDQNENIEWSELKDMSIGHVMTMFNEQQPDEKTNAEPDPVKKELEKTTALDEEVASEQVNTSALNQYINEHKNNNPDTIEKIATDNQAISPDEQADVDNKETDEVTSNESENKPPENASAHVNKDTLKEEITKFTKPDESVAELKPIGPKALPNNKSEIQSKSKMPEEIEMDAAPIFFKDTDETKTTKSPFEKSADRDTLKNEPASLPASKKYKKMSIVFAAVIVLTGGSWVAYSQTQKKLARDRQVTQKQETLAIKTEKELTSYFTNDKQLFIKPEMVSVSPRTIKENLDTLKDDSNDNKLKSVYKKVTDKQAAITKVNELFAQPIIEGNKLNNVAIKADKKNEQTKREEKDDFDKLLNQALDQATSQYDQLQKAKTAVAFFYKNNELTGALTREAYATANTEVNKVKSEPLRKPLNDVLVKADQSLTAAEDQVKIAQAAAQTNTATSSVYQGNNTQPDTNTFSAPNSEGVYTDPVYTVNGSDVSDTNNPAWAWGAGIQEKVIATCIQRGYITAGAYSLQPAKIINSEGYYNLYGADNQYLVTINAKTGWFKGNASRNAGR